MLVFYDCMIPELHFPVRKLKVLLKSHVCLDCEAAAGLLKLRCIFWPLKGSGATQKHD